MSSITLPEGEKFDLDLGDNHVLQWYGSQSSGDRHVGAIIYHLRPRPATELETPWCAGSVKWEKSYDGETGPIWTKIGDDEHLTLSPSVLCSCGDHGFIRDGKWVRA